MEKVYTIRDGVLGDVLGTWTWDRETGAWDYETSSSQVRQALEKAKLEDMLPYHTGAEHDGALIELLLPVTPTDERYKDALASHLRSHAGAYFSES